MHFVATFLGRRLAYTYEVIDYVAGERLLLRAAEGPFPMEPTYEWSQLGEGRTLMRLRNRGRPSGFGPESQTHSPSRTYRSATDWRTPAVLHHSPELARSLPAATAAGTVQGCGAPSQHGSMYKHCGQRLCACSGYICEPQSGQRSSRAMTYIVAAKATLSR